MTKNLTPPSSPFWNPLNPCALGVRVNCEKTEIIALGSNILHEKDLNGHKICEIIKILGVYFGYDEKQRNDLNFRQTLTSIKKSIQM